MNDLDIVVNYSVRVLPRMPPKDIQEEMAIKMLEARLSFHAHKWAKIAEDTFKRQELAVKS